MISCDNLIMDLAILVSFSISFLIDFKKTPKKNPKRGELSHSSNWVELKLCLLAGMT